MTNLFKCKMVLKNWQKLTKTDKTDQSFHAQCSIVTIVSHASLLIKKKLGTLCLWFEGWCVGNRDRASTLNCILGSYSQHKSINYKAIKRRNMLLYSYVKILEVLFVYTFSSSATDMKHLLLIKVIDINRADCIDIISIKIN